MKDREPTTRRADIMRASRGKGGGVPRVTKERKSVSTRESSVGLDRRADAMHFDFYAENKRFIMMLQYLGNSFRPLVDGAPVA